MADSESDRKETQAITRVVLRPYASALPLGFFAFGVGNALLSCFALHWIPLAESNVLAIMLLAFVAPLELIPCILAFLSRDTGGATAMGIFSASWVVQGVLLTKGNPEAPSAAMGIFLLLLASFLAILAFVTFASKPLLGVLLIIALLRSIGASLIQFGIRGAVASITAGLGLLITLFSIYGGLGFLLEDVKQRPLAMTFRRGQAKAAMEGDLQHQLKRVATEAGVRQQL